MIRIITDSGADFEPKEIELLNITVVPLYISFGDVTYQENVNLTKNIFYNLLKLQNQFPTTSQPSPNHFREIFSKIKRQGDEALCIFMSSKISGTYQNGKFVAKEFNIPVIDSESACGGERILVEEAVKLRNQGKSLWEIISAVENLKKRLKLFACINTTEFLQRSGRIPHFASKISTIASIKPVISMSQGKVQLVHKSIGMARGYHYILHRLKKYRPDTKYPIHIIYSHDHGQGVKLKEFLIGNGYPLDNHSLVNIGAVIGSHIGPGACGVAYVAKE